MKLANFASNREKFDKKPETLGTDEVVDIIKSWRIGDESDEKEEEDTIGSGIDNLEKWNDKPLKRDNVAPEEVVKIINK